MGALTLIAALACDQTTTSPTPSMSASTSRPVSALAPGEMRIYRDRTVWETAVAAEGGTVAMYDFTGLTLGHITTRSVDFGPFRIAVDQVSATATANPKIDSLAAASCSVPPAGATCNRFIFNMYDPTSTIVAPKLDSLIMPQPVMAFGAHFGQAGYASGSPVGATTIHFGASTFNLPDSLVDGYGFLGFILGTPTDVIHFTFAKSGSLQNDVIELYKPAFANVPPAPDPVPGMISDLRAYAAGAGLPKALGKKIDQNLALAATAYAANQISTACAELEDVLGLIQGGSARRVSAAVVNEIIAQTNAIRTEIGC